MNVGAEENRYIVYRQMKQFRIEADQPVHMNLDGEPILETVFDFDVLPQQLPAVLPEGAPLSDQPGGSM
jgi:diacylglycerol kinase family enzyme